VFANRGANGIDGVTSTALGVAGGLDSPLLLVVGDLAFLHDLGGLRAARALRRPAVILLLNNNGGGIFSFLPIAQFPELSEAFFRTPHDCDLAPAARVFGLEHRCAETAEAVADLTAETISSGGTRVIEVRTDPAQMAREHAALMNEIATMISGDTSWKRA
jgi:2-succinyl-5-enolpyruvyl-6-hydroxy-3-cyclohexene-1-carboxylate synthase